MLFKKYRQLQCEAVRSVILATAWFLVVVLILYDLTSYPHMGGGSNAERAECRKG